MRAMDKSTSRQAFHGLHRQTYKQGLAAACVSCGVCSVAKEGKTCGPRPSSLAQKSSSPGKYGPGMPFLPFPNTRTTALLSPFSPSSSRRHPHELTGSAALSPRCPPTPPALPPTDECSATTTRCGHGGPLVHVCVVGKQQH